MAVSTIPAGYHSLTPYMIMRGARKAIEFYKQVFGAVELMCLPGMTPDTIGHAEIKIGDSIVMLADENEAWGACSPDKLGGTPVSQVLYVEDVDTLYERAIAAGATVIHPLADKFYGDRMGTIKDPFGHTWSVATHIEDVSPEEITKRAEVEMKKMEGPG